MKWANIAWRVALAALLGMLVWQAYNLPAWTERQIARESGATRIAALQAIADTRKDLLGEVASLRTDLMVRADKALDITSQTVQQANDRVKLLTDDADSWMKALTAMTDTRLKDTDVQLTRANDSLALVTAGLKPILDHAGNIAKQVDDNAPMFLDCDHNPDCVFNRYVGVSKGVERAALNFGQMSTTFNSALPGFVKNADSLVADSAATANNIKRLTSPKWYDRLIGYGLNGVIMYRNLNPVTSLTITGAQFLASRP
jgi:hypothetical protein